MAECAGLLNRCRGNPTGGSNPPLSARGARATSLLVAALAPFLAAGCVERSLLIRTDPPGAVVLLDAKKVGETPVEVPFVYGGTHEIVVYRPKRPGDAVAYRPQVFYYDTESVVFDGPLLDFFVDLAPVVTVEDRHVLDVTLTPSDVKRLHDIAPDAYWEGLLERAELLRGRAREAQIDARPLSEPEPASRPTSRQ